MRMTCTLLLLIGSITATQAQQNLDALLPAPGKYVNGERPELGAVEFREDVLWEEDFANGIPSTWNNEGDPVLAVWEYRGPETTPSNEAGTRGSCVADDNEFGPPIESETAENGFLIFDSNFWDDTEGPCGNFGSGAAPGPHFATLTTGEIDLGSAEMVGMSFNHYFKNYQTSARIEYKVAGADWELLWESPTPLNSGETPKDQSERFNVSEQLGGQEAVQLRFVFDGNYYFWMIDDIKIFQLQQNNLYMDNATYGDFDLNDQGNETGYEWMEYSQYPVDMAPRVFFSAEAQNRGAEEQTNAVLQAYLREESSQDTIYEAISAPQDLASDESFNFFVPDFQVPLEIAEYTAHFKFSQDQEDDSPENNSMVKAFEVTDVTYSRDRIETEGIFVPQQLFNGTPYEVGNMFVITADNQAVESVSIGVAAGSWTGAEMYAKVYKLNTDLEITTEEVATTGNFGLIEDAFNNTGDNNVMTVPFLEPVQLDKDSAYLVVAGTTVGPEAVKFSMSGRSPDLTSFVRFMPNSWFYLIRTPMVRLNFGPVASVEEQTTQPVDFTCYPNPANNEIMMQIDTEQAAAASIRVFDGTGRVVYSEDLGTLPQGLTRHPLNTSSWADGWYVASVFIGDIRQNEMIIVRH